MFTKYCIQVSAALILIAISIAGFAHNKVVVIPLMSDDDTRVYAPIKTDEAPRSDYFLHSETARDLVTGLEWQRNESTFSQFWQDAGEICRDLSLRGFSDWRLPTITELIGITDYTRLSPAISVQAFPNPKTNSDYWSSTIDPFFPEYVRTLNLSNGQVGNSPLTSPQLVRCVRAGISTGPTFIDNNDGTVQDLSFGLMWEKETFSQTFNLSTAIAYCGEVRLGGFRDWRMPTIKELVTLLDVRRANPEMNSVFSVGFLGSVYLMSSALLGNDEVWGVKFKDAFNTSPLVFPLNKDSDFLNAICVRAIS